MDQASLFFDSWLDALKDDVRAIGGPKHVGKTFNVDLGIEQARNWCNDRLSEHRRERFSDSQVRWIIAEARKVRGYSAALAYLCDETGFERPKAMKPEDERAELQRRFIAAVETASKLGERLERITK